VTTRELERLLDLLGKLSEEITDGRLRDMIGELRSECWDLLDGVSA
jgi:hypothetical protein